jgi:DNA-binding transcriptional regulator YiaG
MPELKHVYESTRRPAWLGAVQQIRRAGDCDAELIDGTPTSFTVRTSAPLSPEVAARFELEPRYTDGIQHSEDDHEPDTHVMSKKSWPPERIKQLRQKRGQTQEEFGRDILDLEDSQGLITNVYRWESGRREPRAAVRRTLQRMAQGEI